MDKKLAKTMYLPLAERMASKYVAENKIEAEAGRSNQNPFLYFCLSLEIESIKKTYSYLFV